MRIGINFNANDEYISGVEYYSLGLINALVSIDKNNEYYIYTNRPDLITDNAYQTNNMTVFQTKHIKTRIARIIWEHTQLPKLAQKHCLDVLHCPSYIVPLRNTNIPYVATIHDTIAIDHPEWCKPTNALYYNLLMKISSRKASRIISVSERTANDIKRNFRSPDNKIHVINSGIDKIFNTVKDFPGLNKIKKQYNLPEKYILYVGNIEPKKNLSLTLNLQKHLHQKGFPHKLVIIGKRAWGTKKELVEITKEVKSNNIICTGYVKRNELPSIYQMADVFVFPSLYEGFGFPPLEAMSCGTPVISTSKGIPNEAVAKAAVIVDPFNTNQILQATASIINNSALQKKLIKLGLEVSSHFSWEKTAEETLNIYEKAAQEKCKTTTNNCHTHLNNLQKYCVEQS